MADATHFRIMEALAKGQSGPPTTIITLANGVNSNIPLPATERVRIIGPTAAFSIGSIQGGVDGRKIRFFNTLAQTMTVVNEDGGASSAGFRIHTLQTAAANLVLRATANSFVTISYDGVDNRWIVESFN